VLSLLIFSHGLGGTCEGYEYLGTHWSKNGYIKIFQALIKKSSTEFWDATLKISLNQKYGSAPAILKKKWWEGLSWKRK
jgi:hypothetical protein